LSTTFFFCQQIRKLHTPLEKIRQTISTCTQTKETIGQHSAYAFFSIVKSQKIPITSCTQNGPLPPKQVDEEPQYRDGQYFSSIGISIKICGKANQAH
jgi:hypothetical protein